MGLGKEKCRDLPRSFSGNLPPGCSKPKVYLPGTLVLEGNAYATDPSLAATVAGWADLRDWPFVLVVDDSDKATCSMLEFLWTFFTRFEPAADIHASAVTANRFHVGLQPPVVVDCRMKPWYTDILEVDEATKKLVDSKFIRMIPHTWR